MVAVAPEGVVVAGAVDGVVVAGVCAAVVGAPDVPGPPPMGGWVSGTGLDVVGAALVDDPPTVGASVVDGEAVVVFVVLSPLRTTAVPMPAPRRPRIRTISAMVRSRLREFLRIGRGAGFRPNDYAAWVTAKRGPYDVGTARV